MEEIFPADKFRKVKKLKKLADPLAEYPNRDPDNSDSSDGEDCAEPPAYPQANVAIPLPDKVREPEDDAADVGLSQELSILLEELEEEEEDENQKLSQNLRLPLDQLRQGLSHVGYPCSDADIQDGHRTLAMAMFNYKSAGQVTLQDVYELYFMATGGGGSSSSKSKGRTIRAHESDPKEPTDYPPSLKHKAE